MAQAGTGGYPLKTPAVKHIQIEGSFQPNGSGAVTLARGVGFTVARAGVGVFTVTITRPFAQFVTAFADKSSDETAASQVRCGGFTLPTASANGSFTITHLVAAAAADVTASGALRRINFECTLAESDCPGNGV